jgi:hypothetical protein
VQAEVFPGMVQAVQVAAQISHSLLSTFGAYPGIKEQSVSQVLVPPTLFK